MRWFLFGLALLLSEVFASVDDLINICPLFGPPNQNILYWERGKGLDYELMIDPPFDAMGAVTNVFFRDNSTRTIRNCVRVVGGKRTVWFAAGGLESGFAPLQQSRFMDTYYCHQGVGPSSTYDTTRFSVFNNGFDRRTDPYVNSPFFGGHAPNDNEVPTGFVNTAAVVANNVKNAQWQDVSSVIELGWARDPPPDTDTLLTPGSSITVLTDSTVQPSANLVHCKTTAQIDRTGQQPITPTMVFDSRSDIIQYCLTEKLLADISQDTEDKLSDESVIWRAIAYLNFQSQCFLASDMYTFACLDPAQHSRIARDWIAAYGRTKRIEFFQSIRDIEEVNSGFFEEHSTHGYLQYQSWTKGMYEFLLLNNHIPKGVRDSIGMASTGAVQPSQVSLWSILFAHETDKTRGKAFKDNLAQDQWKNQWAPLLNRADPTADTFMMLCPSPSHDNPGVNRSSICNMQPSNGNACLTRVGRCWCDPHWYGIACDIPAPPGITYQELTADPSDPYEICQTAGNFTYRRATFSYPNSLLFADVTTYTNVPICSCIQGFEGTPDDFKSWVQVYASLFHAVMVSQASLLKGPPSRYFNMQQWFTHIINPQVAGVLHNVVSYSDIWNGLGIPSIPYGVKFDWYWYVMTHQCLIWTQSSLMPSLHVWWDYFSFPFMDQVPQDQLYLVQRKLFPWPSISTTRRMSSNNKAADGKKGVRCMDYKESIPLLGADWTSFSERTSKEWPVAALLQWIHQTSFWSDINITQATLYGGPLCTPCPDCNRRSSVCVAGPDVIYQCPCDPSIETCTAIPDQAGFCQAITPARCSRCLPVCPSGCVVDSGFWWRGCVKQVTRYVKNCSKPGSNICQCDTNFCGPTCDTPVCPITTTGTLCGNGTCVIDPTRKCENLAPGEYGGFCKCNPGYNGTACENPICPLSPTTGIMCSGNPCNEQLGQCECPDMTAGSACELKGCKRVNGLECAGATRADTGESVCNRETQQCECYKTFQAQENDPTKPGWTIDPIDSRILLNARWGRYCEFTFGDACRDPNDGSWCSQPITSTGSLIGSSPAYAACYNETCLFNPSQGIDTQMGGHVCKPYCHCTLEYATPDNTYCRRSICGPDRCGEAQGKGTCRIDCVRSDNTLIEATCTTQEILNGKLQFKANCECGVVNGTYYYHKDPNPVTLMPCTDPAPLCYTGNTSPCNGHGECAYNATSGGFYCICDYGYSGQNCSVAPLCNAPTGEPCVGPTRYCYKDNNQEVCTCNSNYFRDANRTCAQERCVATLGRVTANDTCECPESRPIWSDPPLNLLGSTHRKLGCRKGCPFYESVPCGATALDGSSRCSDLMAGDPIFWDDPRSAPNCSCFFRGKDHLRNTNYWVPDPDTGACKPKCYPPGLCKGDACPSIGQPLNDDNSCNCAPGFEGENCTDHKCPPGQSHHMGDGVCMCTYWCKQGPTCKTDLCLASGGTCQPDIDPNDCVCPTPYLKKDSSKQLFHRNCTSACQNGGTLTPDRSACVCPAPYYGPVCELTQGCNPQWTGVLCNISTCVNGSPLPQNQVGCTCSDAYYSGVLCDQDSCILANRRQRTPTSCVCASGYVEPDCSDPCFPGGTLDLIAVVCACKPGWTLAANQTACLQSTSLNCSGVGTVVTNIYGGQECQCPQEYSGSNCETLTCLPPFVSTGRNRCACPAGSYGSSCSENYCDSYAIGYNATLGLCVCPVGYRISDTPDGSGTRQCEPDPFYCSMFGTRDWSNVSNLLPCQCKTGWSGTHCSSYSFSVQSDSSPVLSPVAVWSIGGGIIVVIILGIIMAVVWCRPTAPVPVATKSRHLKCMY